MLEKTQEKIWYGSGLIQAILTADLSSYVFFKKDLITERLAELYQNVPIFSPSEALGWVAITTIMSGFTSVVIGYTGLAIYRYKLEPFVQRNIEPKIRSFREKLNRIHYSQNIYQTLIK